MSPVQFLVSVVFQTPGPSMVRVDDWRDRGKKKEWGCFWEGRVAWKEAELGERGRISGICMKPYPILVLSPPLSLIPCLVSSWC